MRYFDQYIIIFRDSQTFEQTEFNQIVHLMFVILLEIYKKINYLYTWLKIAYLIFSYNYRIYVIAYMNHATTIADAIH